MESFFVTIDEKLDISISQFVENFVYVEGNPFQGESGFEYWPFLKAVYDTPYKYRLLKASRQCSKSTTTGNLILSHCCLIAGFKALYVSPRQEQANTFSNDRLNMVIGQSPFLKKMTSTKLTNKVTEKMFINNSVVRLRAAYNGPGAVRGIAARMLNLDEIQDLDTDTIPVVLECAATFPTNKIIILSGTPLSMENPIEHYWAAESTMNEWMTRCGCSKWNGTKIENIGETGYVCSKCGKLLDIRTGEWVAGRAKATYRGFHINQLMTPYTHKDWDSIRVKLKDYPLAQFMNEVLGESWDTGVRPITREQLLQCCQPYSMISNPSFEVSSRITVAGLDWGTGGESYTVLTIMMLEGNKYRVLYCKRYSGLDALQDKMLDHILAMLNLYNINKVGCDVGFGYYFNYALQERLSHGLERIVPISYSDGQKKKLMWDKSSLALSANRTMILEDVFQLLKKKDIILPRPEEWMDPFGEDILNEFIEENPRTTKMIFRHPVGRPDDSLQSLAYAVIAAQFIQPRMDMFPIHSAGADLFT